MLLLVGLVCLPAGAQARQPAAEVSAYALIAAMNSLRVSNGLPALVEDPIIDAVAQSTAQTMAASQMSWHIGDVSGRLASAGYGGGSKVWATENFAVGLNSSIDWILSVWSDPDHMLPAVIPAYCNVGAGTAKAANGMTYYILQAAYTSGKSCGEYTSGGTTPANPGGTPGSSVSQLVMPVKIATPDSDGKVFHTVEAGQSFWAIAIAYKITIIDLKNWNNLAQNATLKIGQKLIIYTALSTLSPTLGPLQLLTPALDGKYYHTVRSGETLSWIAARYSVSVNDLMAWNGLTKTSIIQPNQKLYLQVTPPATVTPTPLPSTLTPTATDTPISITATPVHPSPTPTPTPLPFAGNGTLLWGAGILLATAGLGLGVFFYQRKTMIIRTGPQEPESTSQDDHN